MRERVEWMEELKPDLGSRSSRPRGSVAKLVPMIKHLRYAARRALRLHACGKPPHRVLGGRENHIGLEHMVEVGVPATMMIEDR